MANTISLDERIASESETILDDEQKNDYTAVDGLNFLPNLASLIRNSRRNHITKFLMPSKYQITFSFANSYSISLHYETYRKKY